MRQPVYQPINQTHLSEQGDYVLIAHKKSTVMHGFGASGNADCPHPRRRWSSPRFLWINLWAMPGEMPSTLHLLRPLSFCLKNRHKNNTIDLFDKFYVKSVNVRIATDYIA
jgi:hypothetical protein